MRIALVIDSPPSAPYHRATVDAIGHAADALELAIDLRICPSNSGLIDRDLREIDGIVIGPGSPYHDEYAVWDLVRSAREREVPLVGT